MNAIFPIRRFTADEVLRMVEAGVLEDEERLELIDGALVTMSPQNPPHATTVLILERRLRESYGANCHLRSQFPLLISTYDLPEPDVCVVRGEIETFKHRHPEGKDAILVVEVSHTTLARDRAKATLYARGKVRAYWILDLDRRLLIEHRDPRGEEYANVIELGPDDHVALPERDVTWRVADLLP